MPFIRSRFSTPSVVSDQTSFCDDLELTEIVTLRRGSWCPTRMNGESVPVFIESSAGSPITHPPEKLGLAD